MFEPLTDGSGHPNGWPARLHVCGQYEARQLGTECGLTHLLSVNATAIKLRSITGLPEGCHLALVFDDTLDPANPAAPPPSHVQAVCQWIDTLESESRLMIHCLQGISRSTAIALGLLSRYLPPHKAAAALHGVRPWADPNRLITAQWDKALGLEGELIDAARPFPCKVWKGLNAR